MSQRAASTIAGRTHTQPPRQQPSQALVAMPAAGRR